MRLSKEALLCSLEGISEQVLPGLRRATFPCRDREVTAPSDTPDLRRPVRVFVGPLNNTQTGGWATFVDLP